MLAEKPFLLSREKPLTKKEIAQALRWAIEAELDAISFYEQLAELIEDEKIRHVFYDVANEEKEHVGEFLAVLLEVDPELAEYIKKGFKEVEEETGIRAKL
ncbi:rubrerythrin family protein [Thermococcus chitonophagus]|uniref:Ferritin-like di-iron-carboxylate protein n=1 Tax=Thermococcus chitonophagus TaxID=54262 RepID=A0A160VRP8_9EURY|nr:ferritin family protein [Thermococcus chitonophagus]ASJ17037.1 rubrerythrin family protein [Thermococcus chitonophagus]CUX77627.1 Ferritin-like di-iron-carboxylate protein [Thermococcus chitonophagus]